MAKFVIDMPDDWKGPGQYDCNFCYMVNECYPDKCPVDCPIAKAVKAVSIKYWDTENCAGEAKLNGKPVKLWATEDK